MPNNRNGLAEANGERVRNSTGNSRRSGLSGNGYNNRAGSGNENDNEDGLNNNNNNTRAGGTRQNRGSAEYQPSLDLDPYTNDVAELSKSLKNLSNQYAKHADEIKEVARTHERCIDLERKCAEKDDRIKQQRITITELRVMSRDKEEEFAEQIGAIKSERETLEGEKEEFERYMQIEEKKIKAREAEQKIELSKQLGRLQAQNDKEHKDRMEKLEQDMKKREVENKKRLTDLEATNKKLSDELNKKTEEANDQRKELKDAADELEDSKMVKSTLKEQTRKLELQVKMMQDEFASDSRTEEFYKEGFGEIFKTIETISQRYFMGLNSEDFDSIHTKLLTADPTFNSVPISDSEESQSLRVAHAQRIISASLCQVIWQPFSSEKTLPHPQFISLLSEIFAELAKSGHASSGSRRAAGVWKTLTMRALQSLSTASASPSASINQGPHLPSPRGRAEKVVYDVLSVLSPLLSSQEPQFRKDISSLVQAATSVWSFAQTDELKIVVSPTLDPASRSEWRSKIFDPVPSSNDNTDQEIISSTYPRIFTLFPRITAQKTASKTSHAAGPPGSWPESESEPHTIEICIHTGTGLPECSALVLQGKAEEEETKNFLSQAIDKVKKDFNARSRKNGGHSRSGSIMSSTAEPPSPIAKWMKMSDGVRAVVEE